MLRSLHLKDVGPASELKFEFAERLNILTGDNGLGKTFVLDVLWWLLTTTWVSELALPMASVAGDRALTPTIMGALAHRFGDLSELDIVAGGHYAWENQAWIQAEYHLQRRTPGFKPKEEDHDEAKFRPPSLVIYVRSDGSFALWDAYRVKGGIKEFADAALLFDAREVWEGKYPPGDRRAPPVCRGLIEDWRSWQNERSPLFEFLRRVLQELSEKDEPLVPHTPIRVKLSDARLIPTLSTSYGEVPVTLASSAVKRILGLAYLLVWAWNEHVELAKLSRRSPTQDIVVLMDEVELHLHPQWQRKILPSLFKAIGSYAPNVAVQVVATSHSPLVLASLEPIFKTELDALFIFELTKNKNKRRVKVTKAEWRRYGDASDWLTSDVFGLEWARSDEAEDAIIAAIKFLDNPKRSSARAAEIDAELKRALGDTDPFWMRWRKHRDPIEGSK